jgi:hypothetical protein
MATKEQILKWNNQLSNNWQFDFKYFLIWKEKQIILKEALSETSYTTYTMHFTERREGFKWLDGYDVKINKSIWHLQGDMAVSHGLGVQKTIKTNISNKKQYKILADLTKEFPLSVVKSLYTGNEVNPMV